MNARWCMNQFLIEYLLDKKVYLRPLRIYENWGNPYQPRYRVVVAKSIEMSAIFGLDARWSVYYVHCTFCIALKLAPTTLRFRRSDTKIEYSKLQIDSPMRRTNKSASLLYSSYKTIIGMVLNRHESNSSQKDNALHIITRDHLTKQLDW